MSLVIPPANSLTKKHQQFLLQLFQTAATSNNNKAGGGSAGRGGNRAPCVGKILQKATPNQIQALGEVALNLSSQFRDPTRINLNSTGIYFSDPHRD